MAIKAIPSKLVTCKDGKKDYYIGINPNTNTDDKIQAFVDAFRGPATTASNLCNHLPVKMILALWGAESGWGTSSRQQRNQNWGNITYSNPSNPMNNIGKDEKSFAKFEGKNHYAAGFGTFFIKNTPYKDLIKYLKSAKNPDIDICIDYIANAGYCEGDHSEFARFVKDCVKTLVNHSNIT